MSREMTPRDNTGMERLAGNIRQQPLHGEILPAEPSRPTRIRVKKYGFLGAFLRPIGIAIALLLLGWGSLSIGSNWMRGYQRHLEYAKATHRDDSYLTVLLGMAGPALSTGQTKMVYRDINGKLHRVVAATSAVDRFVNQSLLTLDHQRDQVRDDVKQQIDVIFREAFADRDQAINDYADWFFEWKRSYVILKEAIKSTVTRAVKLGEYESLKDAVARDVQDYFMKNYNERVLKPESRDRVIAMKLEAVVRRAHRRYKRIIVQHGEKLQNFLANNTRVLEDLPAGKKATRLVLDWDAQKWKSPRYMVEDRAFDGVVGMGSIAAGGTFGALALGPLISRTAAASFGALSRGVVTSMGSRIALTEGGAAAGTAVAPGIGTAIGTAAGLALGAAADYVMNLRREKRGRKAFIRSNNEALDLGIGQWKDRLNSNVNRAVDRWFDDARAGVIRLRKGGGGISGQSTPML